MAIDHESSIPRATIGPRYDGPSLAAGVAAVAVMGFVLVVLVLRGPLPSLAAAGVFALAAGAVAAPRAFRIAAYIGLVALPLVTAWAALRPDEYDYVIYFAGFALALVGLGALQPRMFTAGAGTLFLGYVGATASVYLISQSGIRILPRLEFLLAAFAVYTLVRRAGAVERRLLLVLVLTLGCVESIIALAQTIAGWPVFTMVLPELLQSDRNYVAYLIPGFTPLVTQGTGTFYHFNLLGALLAICVPLAFGEWLSRRGSPLRIAVLLLTFSGLVVTFSRGGLIAAAAGVLFVLWLAPGRSRRATIVLGLCALVLFSFFAFTVAQDYIGRTQNMTARVATWKTAVDDALDNPMNLIFGYGFEHFHRDILAVRRGDMSVAVHSGTLPSLHSGYLQLLLEFGVVGLALAVGWIGFVFSRGLRMARTTLVISLLAGALAFVAYLSIENILSSYAAVVLAAVMALAEGEIEAVGQSRQSPPLYA